MKLMENGLDSFRKALTKLFELESIEKQDVEFVLKEIVLTYHHSLETLFKYLVSLKNEYLIYDNQTAIFEKIAMKSNKSLMFHTISFMDAFHRVVVLYDTEVSDSVYEAINTLNSVRNSLTHHRTDLEVKEIENLVSSTLPYVLNLLNTFLPDFKDFMKHNDISSNIKVLYFRNFAWEFVTSLEGLLNIKKSSERIIRIRKNGKALRDRVNKLKIEYKDKYSLDTCPLCEEAFFLIEGTIIEDASSVGTYGECRLCGFRVSKDQLILKHISYSEYEDYKEFIIGKLESIMYSYENNYGNSAINEVKCAIKRSIEVFDEFFYPFINEYMYQVIVFIEESQIEERKSEANESNYAKLLGAFENMSPFNRYRFIELQRRLRGFLDIYKTNTDKSVTDIETEYIFNDEPLILKFDDVLSLYLDWLTDKRIRQELFSNFEEHSSFEGILNRILYDAGNGEIWGALAGSSDCDFGTVDSILPQGGQLEYIETIIELEESIEMKCVFEIQIETQAYFDHEMFTNGSQEIYVEADISYDKDEDIYELNDFSLLQP